MPHPIHPYYPATLWFDKEGPQFKEITKREIKAHFEQHHKRFVRYSRLIKMLAPSNRRERRLVRTAINRDLPFTKPDYILTGEFTRVYTFIDFVNPFHRTKSEEALQMTVTDGYRLIAYQNWLDEKYRNEGCRTMIVTNKTISFPRLKQMRDHWVLPVAITNAFLKTVLRTIRRKRSFKERWTHNNLIIKPTTV